MTDQNPQPTGARRVLVIGATGSVGRHVVDGLLADGLHVRATSRNPDAADLPRDVEVMRGDLSDAASIATAAEGMDAAFLLWMGFSSEGADEVVDALARTLPHIVYLSAADLHGDEDAPKEGVWKDVEDLIVASGAKWTFVRGGGFAANTLEWAEQVRSGSEAIRVPFPDAGRSLIDERDIAAVVVRGLTEPALAGEAFSVTGPATLTTREQVEAVGAAIGRDIRAEEQPVEEARADYAEKMGPDYADTALEYWATLVDDPEPPADGVERATGQPPRPYSEWAELHADDFRPLTTAEVAERYRAALGEGDLDAAGRLLAPDVVRVAPLETQGEHTEVQGLAAIAANAKQMNADVDIVGIDVSEPLVGDDHFALRFTFDEIHVPSGEPQQTTKLSLCAVEDSRIVREEVFYFTPAHPQTEEVVA